MIDYTPYVVAVYTIAVFIYGGSTLYWQHRLKTQLRQLAESGEQSHDPS